MTGTASKLRLRLRDGETREQIPLARLSWQPKKADTVWTRKEWTALVEHLHNGNGATRFVMGFIGKDGCKCYVKSHRLPVDRAVSWSWSSISGSPKSKLAFVPYSTNERQESRWGGMDFDAHNGEADRARELAFAAFRVLLNAPDLCIVLETSGSGGWHVWAISPDYHSTGEWVRLLKSVAATIGATITAGVCEIFPPDALPSRFGKGMRAPGCWNPSTDQCNEIVWENTRSYLETVLSGNSKTPSLNCKALQDEFPDKERSISFSPSPGSAYRKAQFLQRLGITSAGTRNLKLARLVGEMFHQVSYTTARQLAQEQWRCKTVSPQAKETEHFASFEKLWSGLASKWTATLSEKEREIFTALETENERDAFRIVRSFARKAKQDGAEDFPVARDNLAERLGITGPGASKIRDKLAKLGVVEKTAAYVPNKFAARFKWLLKRNDRDDCSPCETEP